MIIFTKVVVFCIIILEKYKIVKNLLASLINPLVENTESTMYFVFVFLFTCRADKMENRDVSQA